MVDQLDESQALALWCANLVVLRQRAAAGRWTARLDRAVERVRGGGSALHACEQFGLLQQKTPVTNRFSYLTPRGTDDAPLVIVPGLDPLPLTGRGEYRCPRQRCSRRGERDDHGHPPTCALFDHQPMSPSPDLGPAE